MIRYMIIASISSAITVLLLVSGLLLFRNDIISWFSSSTAEQSSVKSMSLESVEIIPDIIEKTNPAVVSIIATKDVPILERYFEQQWDPFGWFGGFVVPRIRERGTEEREVGGGSGFIVSPDGHVVTNRHVVDDEDARYTVVMNDDTRYNVTVLAKDTVLDIAVLIIEAPSGNLPYLQFSDDTPRLGETVIVIGNALAEFRNSASVGIISGLSRSITARDGRGRSELLREVIQTDAAINPGNSGGPMLNLRGQVVGVSVATTRGANNISFALPARAVAHIVTSVKENGRIVRPYLGIRYTMITPQLQAANQLAVDYGALLVRGEAEAELAVVPESPADKAGLRENDIILEINEKTLRDTDIVTVLRQYKTGDILELKVLHQGIEKRLQVILEDMPEG